MIVCFFVVEGLQPQFSVLSVHSVSGTVLDLCFLLLLVLQRMIGLPFLSVAPDFERFVPV